VKIHGPSPTGSRPGRKSLDSHRRPKGPGEKNIFPRRNRRSAARGQLQQTLFLRPAVELDQAGATPNDDVYNPAKLHL
jgi:hypothetical protein